MGNMSSEKTLQNNKHADELDEGALQQIQECSAFSSTAEKRLVRKIDIMILPIMTFAYMMAFLDKQALSYTAIMGLRTDLNLKGSEYSWSGSIFYFGYLFFSYPASILMVKFPLGKYLACNFMLWAIVLACHAATTNFAGLMVARFFLGCTEASVSSGFSLITSLWYRTSEQPLRHGIWFCGNSISMIIGNLVAVGIWQIKTGLQSWKWLFIIFGIITFLWGILMFFRLPDTPNSASFLTEGEKLLAIERLKANKAGYKRNKIDTSQIIEAFVDPKTWLLAVMILGFNIPNGGFTTFSSLILYGFGFSTFKTLLLGMPVGAVILVFVLLSSAISSKIQNCRCIVIAAVGCISILGSALVYATESIAARYAGLLLMGVYSVSMPLSLAMVASNIGGFSKRATVSAIYFVMYCAGNIVGPQLFFESEAPRYQSGFQAVIVCFVVVVVVALVLGVYLRWENRRRDRVAGPVEDDEKPTELVDITDLANMQFRYVY
ncbi:putative MFS allantoate transporter [Aspergillus fischeri NRRL 181]|uniref:Allantoate permease n=1 Tax=Neosartorya fischeri (strain ATCC 1020 / DSM 3700 / CBS 544.65 / FGSC A1164 / JCM 1740 / NRRL 181 / WB 181) TaxID=331117 RepID=A1DLL0_NEOFI|nr:allantoate permease [Aspergillus fischeri NRRL 181]EAW15681.1 allantoate permease [Aspergillus fischeri NRRL 181]